MKLNFQSFFNEDEYYDELLEFRGANSRSGANWISTNQITRLPKMGFFNPYSAVFDGKKKSENKFYKFTDELPISDPLVNSEEIQSLQRTLEEVTNRIGKLGIRRQKQSVVFIDFKKNKKTVDGSAEIFGFADPSTGTIYIDRNLFFNDLQEFKDTLTHEFAHSIWFKQFNKETKMSFINWYKDNIISPSFKTYVGDSKPTSIEITPEEKNDIWKTINTINHPLRKKLENTIPDLITNLISTKSDSISQTSFKTYIKNSIISAFKRDKTILQDKSKFLKFLSGLKITQSMPVRPKTLNSNEHEALRTIAFENGSTPSEYAATNPEELWAEAIAYASQNIGTISKSLKTMISNMISGIV